MPAIRPKASQGLLLTIPLVFGLASLLIWHQLARPREAADDWERVSQPSSKQQPPIRRAVVATVRHSLGVHIDGHTGHISIALQGVKHAASVKTLPPTASPTGLRLRPSRVPTAALPPPSPRAAAHHAAQRKNFKPRRHKPHMRAHRPAATEVAPSTARHPTPPVARLAPLLQAVASARSAEDKAAMTSKRLAAIPGVSSNIVAEIVAGSGMAPSGVQVLPATAASKHGTTVLGRGMQMERRAHNRAVNDDPQQRQRQRKLHTKEMEAAASRLTGHNSQDLKVALHAADAFERSEGQFIANKVDSTSGVFEPPAKAPRIFKGLKSELDDRVLHDHGLEHILSEDEALGRAVAPDFQTAQTSPA